MGGGESGPPGPLDPLVRPQHSLQSGQPRSERLHIRTSDQTCSLDTDRSGFNLAPGLPSQLS